MNKAGQVSLWCPPYGLCQRQYQTFEIAEGSKSDYRSCYWLEPPPVMVQTKAHTRSSPPRRRHGRPAVPIGLRTPVSQRRRCTPG